MDDEGYSLIEVLVVVVLLGIVGSIVTNLMIGGLQQQRQITARISTVEDLRVVMQRMTRDIRNSDYRAGALGTSLTLCLDTTGGSRQLTYATRLLTGGNALVLDENDYTSACANPATGTKVLPTKVILAGVPTAPSTPLFAYDHWDGFTTTSASVNPISCLVAGSAPAAYSGSCLGTVTLTLAAQPTSGPVITLTDEVDLRNLA